MKFKTLGLLTVLLVCFIVEISFADTLVDWYGDDDGFGLAVGVDDSFNWNAVSNSRTEGLTDFFTNRSDLHLQWNHEYNLSNSDRITGAWLEIFSGGQGVYGLSEVFLNDILVGTLTRSYESGNNYARKDIFNLSRYFNMLDGSETIRVETQNEIESDPNSGCDNWVLDYSKLKIEYIVELSPTPEPTSMMLFGFGILLFSFSGRGKKQ